MPSKRTWVVSLMGIGLAVLTVAYLHNSRSSPPPPSSPPYWTPNPGVVPVPAWVQREGPPVPPIVNFTPAQLQSSAQVKLLTAKAEGILVGWKKAGESQHLDFAGADSFQPESGRVFTASDLIPRVELQSADYTFYFREQDNFFFAFMNRRASRLDVVLTEAPDKPKWSEEQAIQIGTAYLKCLVDPSQYGFTPGEAKYDTSHTDMREGKTVYHAGNWIVTWNRAEPKGVLYSSYAASIEISEKWGVTSAALWLNGIYVEQKGERMSADIAITIAKHSNDASRSPSSGIIDYKIRSCELLLVQPYSERANPWRVAYVISMDPVYSSSPHPAPTHNHGEVVFVDALTGQIIGGLSML